MKSACPLCQEAGEATFKEQWGDFEILECCRCRLVYSSPMKAGDAEYYQENTEYDDKWDFTKVLERFEALKVGGNLLDVACGDGRFLALASANFQVEGIDFNPLGIEAARKKVGQENIHAGTLKEFKQKNPNKKFTVITLFHILEHLEQPHEMIKTLSSCLEPSGYLAVAVPNRKRWAQSWVQESWDYPPHHLTRWSEENIVSILTAHGFTCVESITEKMTSYRQVYQAVRDIVWSLVIRKVHFGVGAKIDASMGAGHAVGSENMKTAALQMLKKVLLGLKGLVIQASIAVVSVALFPFLILIRPEGKSLLVIARKNSGGNV